MDNKQLADFLAQSWGAHRKRFIVRRELDGSVLVSSVSDTVMEGWLFSGPSKPGAAPLRLQHDIMPVGVSFETLVDGCRMSRERPLSEALRMAGVLGDAGSLAERSVALFRAGITEPRIAARLPLDGLRASEHKRFKETGLGELLAPLSEQALQALAAVDTFGEREYKFYAEPGEKGDTRRQAAGVYPLLAGALSARFSLRDAIDTRSPLLPAIQESFGNKPDGTPRIGKSVMRALQGNTWPAPGITPERLAYALGELPPDWMPKERAEWDAFVDIATTVGDSLPQLTGQGVDVLYAGCGGKWVEFRGRLAKSITDMRPPEGFVEEDVALLTRVLDRKVLQKAPPEKVAALTLTMLEGAELHAHMTKDSVVEWMERLYNPPCNRDLLSQACRDVADMREAFVNKVVMPKAASLSGAALVQLSSVHIEHAAQAANEALFAGQNAANILASSRLFHAQSAKLLEAGCEEEEVAKKEAEALPGLPGEILGALGAADAAEWPYLCDVVMAPNGLYLVPLVTTEQLRAEGQELHHCVGGYSSACSERGHHIISVRELSYTGGRRSLSTCEFSAVSRDTPMSICQHRADHNRSPETRAMDAMAWYVACLDAGLLPINYDRIRVASETKAKRSGYDQVRPLCGYDWRRGELIEAAAKPWGRFVGKALRVKEVEKGASPDDIEVDMVKLVTMPSMLQVAFDIEPALRRRMGMVTEEDIRVPTMGMVA